VEISRRRPGRRDDRRQARRGRRAGGLPARRRADRRSCRRLQTPDIRLDDDDLLSLRYDANQSLAATVLAVRGHFTDPRNQWNPSDAAIYGDPYAGTDETQRTQPPSTTTAVQSHNHINRLQKLAFIRANAPRVSVVISYDRRDRRR
jgi:hypothetical protein